MPERRRPPNGWRPDQRARRLSIDVKVAHPKAFAGKSHVSGAAGVDPAGQGEVTVHGKPDSLLKRADAHARQHGSKYLFASDHGVVWHIPKDRGCDVKPARAPQFIIDSPNVKRRALRGAVFDITVDPLHGFPGDYGPKACLGILGPAERKALRGFDEAADKGVVNRFEDDNPRACGTLFPRTQTPR